MDNMAYINVEVSNHGAESRYTTGEVTLTKDEKYIKLFSVDDKERKIPVDIELSRSGMYDIIVHIFTKTEKYVVANICIPGDASVVTSKPVINKDMDGSPLQWSRNTLSVFAFNRTFLGFRAGLYRDGSEVCQFFIEVHYRS